MPDRTCEWQKILTASPDLSTAGELKSRRADMVVRHSTRSHVKGLIHSQRAVSACAHELVLVQRALDLILEATSMPDAPGDQIEMRLAESLGHVLAEKLVAPKKRPEKRDATLFVKGHQPMAWFMRSDNHNLSKSSR